MNKTQKSKLLSDIPKVDIVIKMGCNVVCPYLYAEHIEDWGLEDPTGKSDEEFIKVAKAIEEKVKVRNINIAMMQDVLLKQGTTLIYYKDVSLDDEDFLMVQYMGLRGFLPEWEAKLDEAIEEQTLSNWKRLSKLNIKIQPGISTRREILNELYAKMKK